MKPEEKARQQIDLLLEQAGWKVQDYRELNLGASLGVAVREFSLTGLIELPLGYRTGYIATKLVNKYYKKFQPKEFGDVQVMYLTRTAC